MGIDYLRNTMKLYLDNDHFIDTTKPLDISMSLSDSEYNPRAWYVDKPRFEPVRTEHYIGSVREGGSVNFRNIFFNPHGHGTHTECLGHITEEVHSVNDVINQYFFKARVASILPKRINNDEGGADFVIMPEQLEGIDLSDVDALVIRTMPNEGKKLNRNYSNTNPPYLHVDCAQWILKNNIEHLLVDVPSVDRESDDGKLAFHHAFWEVPGKPNFRRTITELIFVDNMIPDGQYILNFQIAPFVNDAAPSRPVLYKIH